MYCGAGVELRRHNACWLQTSLASVTAAYSYSFLLVYVTCTVIWSSERGLYILYVSGQICTFLGLFVAIMSYCWPAYLVKSLGGGIKNSKRVLLSWTWNSTLDPDNINSSSVKGKECFCWLLLPSPRLLESQVRCNPSMKPSVRTAHTAEFVPQPPHVPDRNLTWEVLWTFYEYLWNSIYTQ